MYTNMAIDFFLVPSIEYYATNYTFVVSGVLIEATVGINIDISRTLKLEYRNDHEVFSFNKEETTVERTMEFVEMQMIGTNLVCSTETIDYSATAGLWFHSGDNELLVSPISANFLSGGMGLTLTPLVPVVVPSPTDLTLVSSIHAPTDLSVAVAAASATDLEAALAPAADAAVGVGVAGYGPGANVALTGLNIVVMADDQLSVTSPVIGIAGTNGIFDFIGGLKIECGVDIEMEANDIGFEAVGCISMDAPEISLG
jgi:hypothetical protein